MLKLDPGDRELELILLRHELSILRRTVKKPRLRPADRMILAAPASRLPRRTWAGMLVRPETVLGWHRALVPQEMGGVWAPTWSWSTSDRQGLPTVDTAAGQRESVLGYTRIRGELLKLGHVVSATSIRNLMQKHQIPTSSRRSGLSWREFLRAQASTILAIDYFTVVTWTLRRLVRPFSLS